MLNLNRFTRALRGSRSPSWEQFMVRARVSSMILACYWVAIFVATHVPGRHKMHGGYHWDKVAHFSAFTVLAALLAWTWCGNRVPRWTTLLTIALVVALYGAADEWSQSFVPNRHADYLDWAADMCGTWSGLAAFTWHVRRRQRPSPWVAAMVPPPRREDKANPKIRAVVNNSVSAADTPRR